MQNVSLCVTILNEEKTIAQLLEAVAKQTVLPNEMIIVDGGSTDNTQSKLSDWKKRNNVTFPIRTFKSKGNRSLGRNTAIIHAAYDWIVITDAGCLPHPDWLEELLNEQTRSRAKVIAGYYDAISMTPLEEAMVPYVLVMPDKVDPHDFLPATRSMLLHKSIWKKAGGFDQSLSDNEDYAFANKIAKLSPVSFAKAAKVSWIPRQTLRQFYCMLYRFARGDIQAKIIRPKVILVYLRYLLGISMTFLLLQQTTWLVTALFVGICAISYGLWAIAKNKRYTPHGWYWLPVLQYLADCAVMLGSIAGLSNHNAHAKI